MMSRSCSPTRAADAGLRRVMFTAAGILLLVLLCAAPAAASAADAVVFGGGTFETAEKLADALGSGNATADGGTLTLLTDLNLTGTINITGKMTILGADHTIWRGGKDFHLINVTGSDGNLTLGSDETSKLTVDGQGTPFTGKKGPIVVTSGGNLTMKSGVNLTNSILTELGAVNDGGGVTVRSGGTFTMYGGEISNNRVQYGTGGVHVASGGTFTMYGGEISNNTITDTDGGGVYVYGGTFTMSGGTISDNTAGNYAGGVAVRSGGTFTLSGGTISDNTAISGGGVYVYGGTFMMSGGTISDNTAGNYAGGVYVMGGTFTMSGGIISDNTAGNYAGGVYVMGGTFTMSGGTISDNAAVNNGGGVYMSGGTLTLSGGTISDNTATKNGGGVYVGGGTFIMNGSAAVTADNDVYLVSGKKITVNGAMSGGGAQNITHAVTTAGTIVVSVDYSGGTAKSVKQYFKLNSLLASEQRIGLTAEGNDLKIGALVPEVDDPTVFVTPYTSTVANVSFNLTTASGATKVYVNLTPVSGGTPIATQYTGTISPGMGVVNHQVPGLTAGTAYTLNITPWNDTTEGTLFTTTYTAPSPVYTVTVQNDGHGTGSASPAGGVAGTAITLTSSPASGYQFKAWQVVQGSVSVSGNTFPMPAENVILKALFEPQTTPTPAPTQPRPPSSGDGGGFSSTDSGSVSATGQVSFGTTTGVTRISFAPGTSGTVTIDTKPTGVTPPPDSYIVIDITGPAFEGYAQIEFSVPVALLTDRGLTVYDVSLRHFIGGKWVTLRTHYLGEERGAANYIAATQTFSPFAIVYEKGGAEIIESATPEPTGSTTARPTVQETSGDLRPASGVQNTPAATTAAPDGGTPVPTLTQAPAPVFGALAGLLAAGVLFRRRE